MSLKAELSLEDLTELLEQIKLKVDVDDAGRPFECVILCLLAHVLAVR